ncbi:alanyl-tRNA editing protein [Pseudomonas sediminis]|uniref:alanyl-tRNA editing protein n=1 Tax=Pseudomonas sediminis TaxID=1691904 RepID=UPI0024481219|nr:alanyl-tRNA editing protein [Pseudomonas sediminis]MDG9760049.1 alanyl-tRNA editing protein [Pseudomonas sediminis]
MTQKLFWQNPYQTEHDTVVSSVEGAQITLESTIFFAFSGGQESDHGTIGGYEVVSAIKNNLEIIYTLPDDHQLRLGEPVRIEIDWERRHRLMRLHFAAELVLELFYKKIPGIKKVGAHIAQNKARIDFEWPESISPLLPEFSDEANRIIESGLKIHTDFDDMESERRYWEIEGFSKVPCGGTHVRTTREIGPIKLKRNNIGRGKERVDILLVT